MELLVVVAIILTIAAIVVPAYRSSVSQSKRSVCTSNLRQITVAAQLYLKENGDLLPEKLPYDFRPLIPYIGDRNLCKCPEDHTRRGVNFQAGDKLGSLVSYVPVVTDEPVFMSRLKELDQNFGLFACVSHGSRRASALEPPYLYSYFGPILRARLDTSVKFVEWPVHCYRNWEGSIEHHRLVWGLFTDVPPPQDVVDLMSGNDLKIVPCPE
jgi:hypothetical protein